MSMNKVNVDGVLLFEQSFVKVPYENYRKVFRTSQKATNELKDVTSLADGLAKRAATAPNNTNDLDTADALKTLEAMIAKVEGIKKKLTDIHANSGKQTLSVMRDRLNHLDLLEPVIPAPVPAPTPTPAALPMPPALGSAPASTPQPQARDGSTLPTASATPAPAPTPTPTPAPGRGTLDRLDPVFDQWSNTRLDRWLVDWALRSGKERTAKMLAREKGIERLVDIDLFMDIHRIEDALRRHSCTEALVWCNENKSALKKIKSTLEFDLRLQEYIELARKGRRGEAILYIKKHLIPWQDTHLLQIRQSSALLAFQPTTNCGPYKRLYDPARWTALSESFRVAIYTLNTLPTQPFLHLALYAGLASLKLPMCFAPEPSPASTSAATSKAATPEGDEDEDGDVELDGDEDGDGDGDIDADGEGDFLMTDEATDTSTTTSAAHTPAPTSGPTVPHPTSPPPAGPLTTPTTQRTSKPTRRTPTTRNIDCPVCDPTSLGTLALEVPFSHHLISHIVCSLTGRTIDADNPPLAFPNGYVYSREALERMARANQGVVTCPRSGERCSFGALKKVYIS